MVDDDGPNGSKFKNCSEKWCGGVCITFAEFVVAPLPTRVLGGSAVL